MDFSRGRYVGTLESFDNRTRPSEDRSHYRSPAESNYVVASPKHNQVLHEHVILVIRINSFTNWPPKSAIAHLTISAKRA